MAPHGVPVRNGTVLWAASVAVWRPGGGGHSGNGDDGDDGDGVSPPQSEGNTDSVLVR